MFNANIISDDLYDKWSFELKDLIDTFPEIFKKSCYYKQFKGFIPDSGYYLDYKVKRTRAIHIYNDYKKRLKQKKH